MKHIKGFSSVRILFRKFQSIEYELYKYMLSQLESYLESFKVPDNMEMRPIAAVLESYLESFKEPG